MRSRTSLGEGGGTRRAVADALEHLDELMRIRTTLNAEWRLELRRDIALDPAFARLRKDIRLRAS